MSMLSQGATAIGSLFAVVIRTAKVIENISEAGEKYSHVAVNHADFCDKESQLKHKARLEKLEVRVQKAMAAEEETLL